MSTIVTAKELAKQLSVQTETIHAWHRRGWIPCLRAGRRPVLFDVADVLRALQRRAEDHSHRRRGGQAE